MSSFLPWVSVVLNAAVIHNASAVYSTFTTPGTAKGDGCVFPFIYRGNSFSSCISFRYLGFKSDTMWCSMTGNYDIDKKWKKCREYDICPSYKTLSDPWRNVGFKSTSFPGWPKNDHHIRDGWYRFTGIGGDVLSDFCVPNSSGSNMSLSLGSCRGTPTSSIDGYLDTCNLGISYSSECVYAEQYIQRINCRGFYLYYLTPSNGSFSTRHSSCSASSCGPNAHCNSTDGSCACDAGFSIPDDYLPTGNSYGCSRDDLKQSPDIMIPEACKFNATLDCTNKLLSQIDNITTEVFSPTEVKDVLEFLTAQQNSPPVEETSLEQRVSSFNEILGAREKVVSTLVKKTEANYSVSISLQTTEVRVFVVGPNCSLEKIPQLQTEDAQLEIDLIGISKNDMNAGNAAVAFISYTNMSDSSLFGLTTDPMTVMMSTVVSATLSRTSNTSLTKPVNFTLRHTADLSPNESQSLSCVYWKVKEWVVDGCTLTNTNISHTICSCTHLSTFALIMQTHPQKTRGVLELINTVAVSVGMVCLVLSLLTFFLCRRNSRVTKTTRVNLCISLLLAHLLFLLTQSLLHYIKPHQVVCAVLAGVLQFLFLSAFVWMSIEAVLLFISVKNLSRLNQKSMLGWKRLTAVGYGIPLVVVGVSAGVMPGGYGSEKCWLRNERNLVWSFLGPVCFMLVSNVILFSLIANSLRSSLTRLNSQVSQINQTRIVVFKTVVQFFILGCPWILGFFTSSSKILEVLFLFLNSQQGTFIFLIHCILNKEVRQEYRKLLYGFQPILTATTMTEIPNTRGGNAN
ncbi:adhesion G protein-coupled receptor E3-like [Astyanax mexicanus]|uniref:Adhesion G protein-coupled receptor E3-like n=1 Tax=Astyanax mexicanus TaxID=7994 RepID=A0A8T2KT98_ASTMX|nr:adhesion G protein-coupled receptor E3-like [Astyanax mexicanus]